MAEQSLIRTYHRHSKVCMGFRDRSYGTGMGGGGRTKRKGGGEFSFTPEKEGGGGGQAGKDVSMLKGGTTRL